MNWTKKIWVMGIFLAGFAVANATLQISMATDKPVYQLEEDITVYVTAYNSGTEAETLTFTDSIHASYEMDGVYNWADGRISQPYGFTYILNASSSRTWTLTHGVSERLLYPLQEGTHSVIGQVWALELIGRESEAVSFTVVPEPMTISLLAFGFLLLRRAR